MRLIDADALIDKCGEWYTEEGTDVGYIGTIKGIVDSMPTIEPEVKFIRLPHENPVDMFPLLTAEEKQQSREYVQGFSDALAERKKGKWVEVHGFVTPGGDPVWCCSECGKGLHVYGIEHGTYGADVADGQWVACPNCGADMREEPCSNS